MVMSPSRSCARTSFCSCSASPRMSNPGPRLATLAGTATLTRIGCSDLDGASERVRVRGDLEDRTQGALHRTRILEPVPGEHADCAGAGSDVAVANRALQHGERCG